MPSETKMVIYGEANVNNQAGYTFTVTASDNGSPGAGLDEFGIVVKDPDGNVFLSVPPTKLSGGDLVKSNA